MRSNKTHPWELAWREERWAETSPPLPVIVDFANVLKREGAKRILDLGCGAGRHSILLGEAGFQVVALDISETALKTLEARLKTASIDNVTLVRHDMLELPFTSDYFDGVICTNVLHHGKLVQIKRATEEVHRVMREGTSAFVVALSTADFRRGNGRKLEPNTYVFTEGEERGIIHHFFSRHELQSCFKEFEVVSFEERLLPVEEGGNRAHFLVRLRKS
ncbi:class I SAM-dependent methyltransferase [Candidatus Bathyarchaeota archaeon]|nr:MAG: class I SAM-dependent methyltransferase [Candidatus Bathyarchaeota archaeon]